MPSESTNLISDSGNFRIANRSSNLRANIFLVECILVLAIYVTAVYTQLESPHQTHLLIAFGVIYMIRLNLMSRWILKRELAIEEVTFVILIWLPGIMASFVFFSKEVSNIQLVVSIVVYVLGSYLNSWSEIERKIWKEDTQNKGRCYTLGLFSLSRNINYFGDTLLFTGWALAAGNWSNMWAPITMGLLFYFYHIPDKETYLETRYADDWPAYKKSTPHSFIPFIC